MTTQEQEKSSFDDESQDEAVSLFSQIADSDSSEDSELQSDEEQLDNEEEVDEQTDHGKEPMDDDVSERTVETDTADDTEDDPWADAPESLREEHFSLKERFEHFQNDHKANSERVSALNRTVSQLREQLKAREESQGTPDNASGPTADDLKGKTFEQVEEEWPEVAEFVRHQVNQVQSQFQQQLTPIQNMRQQLEADQQERAVQSELARLAEVHPDYADVAGDPKFIDWINQQSPGVQQLYGSSLADDNIVLLNLYKGTNGAADQLQTETPAKNESSLQDYTEIPKKGSGRTANNLNDDDIDPVQLFNQIAK